MNKLTSFIQNQRQNKPLLLMTHVVYGYPTIEKSLEIMQLMLDNGVEILEVQFPFSDPVADGPTITNACHHALEQNPKLTQCLQDIKKLARQYPQSRVLLMSYLNPLLQPGFTSLAQQMGEDISGIIIPDLSIDHHAMLDPLSNSGIAPIWLITPDMKADRIRKVTEQAQGMLYCVSRSGVTGQKSTDQLSTNQLSTAPKASALENMQGYLNNVRQFTSLPLAVGFGINTAEDISALKGHADVAIVGSAFLNAFNKGGLEAVARKLSELQA
ncbi:tryptophan synthase subunit alpha [Neptunomonas antarctica]|uniref:Tryptophan synthase alpha chain n=1 Tax=Neptunomonas antarctica TaxID=619304 RepID=A0A1N7JVY1_9GAMM|nr:tryptophan synthase subunit alpha [Neptunomonas antarctica]SIS53515.1 tryptophan synthase, alpha chain [Neptunomonas antarctica]